jgi:hypothetical protein
VPTPAPPQPAGAPRTASPTLTRSSPSAHCRTPPARTCAGTAFSAQEPHERIKWVEFSFRSSPFLTADAVGIAGRARSRAAPRPPWRPPPLLPPPASSDLADPGHELHPAPQPPNKRRNGRVGRQCSSRGDEIALCGVCRTVLRRPGSRRHAAESDERACVRRGKSGVEEERTREQHCVSGVGGGGGGGLDSPHWWPAAEERRS